MKILRVTGTMGIVGTDFTAEYDLEGDESPEEIERIAKDMVNEKICWDYEVIEE